MSAFDHCIEFVLRWEGGYVDDPADPGGRTRYGISQRAYPDEDIQHLTLDRAKELYRRDYWDEIRGDDLPLPVALAVLDFAVNSGVRRASRYLQMCVGAKQDGHIGPMTVAAVNARPDLAVCRDLIRERIRFLVALNRPRFVDGWLNRCIDLAFEAARSTSA